MEFGIHLLPAFLFVFSSSMFLLSYCITILHYHTDVFLPYISDTATTPPECCIFGLMTFITALAGVSTMYVRYKYIEAAGVSSCCNGIAFGVGLLSCLGMCVVGTFQVTVIPSVHRVGAGLFFVFGEIYMIMQTCISRKANYYGNSIALYWCQILLATVTLLAVVPMITCTLLVKTSKMHWTGEEKDYGLHIASVVLEWVAAASLVLYFATYIREFKNCTITVKTDLKRHGNKQRNSDESERTYSDDD